MKLKPVLIFLNLVWVRFLLMLIMACVGVRLLLVFSNRVRRLMLPVIGILRFITLKVINMANVKFDLSESEVFLIGQCIDVRQAQIKRSFNAANDAELKSVFQKQALALADLARKFPRG